VRAVVNGLEMAYTDEGTGLPLLFLHGFPLSRGIWSKQVDAFKTRHRVIAPDLRGFGESATSPGLISMHRFAEDLHALMQHLVTGPVILAGHSMGGFVALAFASAFPKFIRGLVLVGMKAGVDGPEIAAARRAEAEKVSREGSSVLVKAMAPRMLSASEKDEEMALSVRDLMASSSSQGVIGALLGMAERPDMASMLGKIRVPTLVIAGSDDTLVPPSDAEALARSIPGAQLNLIPKAGHLVGFEQAAAFNEVMRNWLAWGSNGLPRMATPSLSN